MGVAVLAALQAVQPPGRDGAAPPSRPEAAQSRGDALVAAHPGLTPIPVRFPDAAMAALLEPGDRITLLATDGSGGQASGAPASTARVVAGDVEVLQQVPDGTESRDIGAAAGRLVIVGVTAGSVASVAAAAVRSVLTYAWGR